MVYKPTYITSRFWKPQQHCGVSWRLSAPNTCLEVSVVGQDVADSRPRRRTSRALLRNGFNGVFPGSNRWSYVFTYHIFGHTLGVYPLKLALIQALYMVGSSNLGSWNGHWWLEKMGGWNDFGVIYGAKERAILNGMRIGISAMVIMMGWDIFIIYNDISHFKQWRMGLSRSDIWIMAFQVEKWQLDNGQYHSALRFAVKTTQSVTTIHAFYHSGIAQNHGPTIFFWLNHVKSPPLPTFAGPINHGFCWSKSSQIFGTPKSMDGYRAHQGTVTTAPRNSTNDRREGENRKICHFPLLRRENGTSKVQISG